MDLTTIARGGVFSTADAERVGMDSNALRRLVRDGACTRLTRGWFAPLVDGPLDARRRHVLTARALGRQLGDRAAVSHHSRVIMAGLPTYAVDLTTVHLTSVLDRLRSTDDGTLVRRNVTVRRPGVVVHEPLTGLRIPTDVPAGAGRVAMLPLSVALVQTGLLAGPEAFLVSADAAARAGVVSRERLAEAVGSFTGHPGVGPIRAVAGWVETRHESPGESRTAHLLRTLGFDVEPQVELVVEGRVYRPDFRIRGTRVLVEFDGAVKYADGRRETLFEEKRREDALRRAGWVVVRVVWEDLRRPALVMARLHAALGVAT